MNTGILSLYWTLSNICQYLTGGLWPAWCYQLKEPSKLINFCPFIHQIRKRSSCKNGLIFSCFSASFQEWKWSINTCEINKSVIKAVFNLGIKLVICGRDDFTCKEPLLLTLRALINEEYRDTCKGKCKCLWTGQICSIVFPHVNIYRITIDFDSGGPSQLSPLFADTSLLRTGQ